MTEPNAPEIDTTNPWTTRTSEPIYDNPWIHLTHRTVTTPAGTPGIYGHLHFKTIGVGVIPIDDDDHTWLVGQYRYALDEYTWEIPEGGCPLGTDPVDAARRELREECGLIAARIEPLIECTLSNSITDERGALFTAHELTSTEPEPEATESFDYWRLPVDEAINLAHRGQIIDSLSLIGLLHLGMTRAGSGRPDPN